jgi:hypothetical protein
MPGCMSPSDSNHLCGRSAHFGADWQYFRHGTTGPKARNAPSCAPVAGPWRTLKLLLCGAVAELCRGHSPPASERRSCSGALPGKITVGRMGAWLKENGGRLHRERPASCRGQRRKPWRAYIRPPETSKRRSHQYFWLLRTMPCGQSSPSSECKPQFRASPGGFRTTVASFRWPTK